MRRENHSHPPPPPPIDRHARSFDPFRSECQPFRNRRCTWMRPPAARLMRLLSPRIGDSGRIEKGRERKRGLRFDDSLCPLRVGVGRRGGDRSDDAARRDDAAPADGGSEEGLRPRPESPSGAERVRPLRLSLLLAGPAEDRLQVRRTPRRILRQRPAQVPGEGPVGPMRVRSDGVRRFHRRFSLSFRSIISVSSGLVTIFSARITPLSTRATSSAILRLKSTA